MRTRTWTLSLLGGLLAGCPGGGSGESGSTGMMTDTSTSGMTSTTPTTSPTPLPTTTSPTMPMDSTSTGGPPPPACADADLGSMVGTNLLTGTNRGAGDDIQLACPGGFDTEFLDSGFVPATTTDGGFISTTGGSFILVTTTDGGFVSAGDTIGGDTAFSTTGGKTGAEDYTVAWTAPSAGTYTISLEGSDYDTVLGVLDGCDGDEIECNDDCFELQSGVVVSVAAGQQIIIVIEGFSGETGNFELSITEGEARCEFF